jgi:hypothetical protein
LKGPSRGLPENGMKPKFAPAQPECLERGALVTYAREVIAGLRPASGGPRVTTIVAETRKSDFNLQI